MEGWCKESVEALPEFQDPKFSNKKLSNKTVKVRFFSPRDLLRVINAKFWMGGWMDVCYSIISEHLNGSGCNSSERLLHAHIEKTQKWKLEQTFIFLLTKLIEIRNVQWHAYTLNRHIYNQPDHCHAHEPTEGSSDHLPHPPPYYTNYTHTVILSHILTKIACSLQ